MPLTCPACSSVQADATVRFCEDCGGPLANAAASPLPAPAKGGGCRCGSPDPDAEGYCQVCGVRVAVPPRAPDFEMSFDAGLAVASDRGKRHPTNQDGGAVSRRDDGATLLVVADGVSTSDNAEAASAAAVAAAVKAFYEAKAPVSDLALQARDCVLAAAKAVLAVPKLSDQYEDGPASTVVLAVVRDRSIGLAWIGDSRAYVVMPGVPETALTKDDSWCVEQVDSGKMTYEKALLDPNAHAITQWLGMGLAEMKVRSKETTLPPGSSLLLCSDGLWNYVDAPRRLGAAFSDANKGADAAETCRRLVALANDSGGHDNVTVALLVP